MTGAERGEADIKGIYGDPHTVDSGTAYLGLNYDGVGFHLNDGKLTIVRVMASVR